ncbi:hypothetical protein ACWCYY_18425 [Kitasatospora sp. NPDC001664]
MNPEEIPEGVRQAVRREAAAELMRLHDQAGRSVQPGLWRAAVHLDPSLDSFGGE